METTKGALKKGMLARIYFEILGIPYPETRRGMENARLQFIKLHNKKKLDEKALNKAFEGYIEELEKEYQNFKQD